MPKVKEQPPESPGFSESLEALETILEQFKQGTTTLEESLALFENGVQHLKMCQEKLTRAKGVVDELVESLKDGGEIVTQPFDE